MADRIAWDRWILFFFVIFFAIVIIYGLRIGNAGIADFGKENFPLFSGALLILLNHELLTNGKKNGNDNITIQNPPPPSGLVTGTLNITSPNMTESGK